MAKLNPPESFDFTKPQQWEEWKRRFQRYRTASKLFKENGEIQVSTLIYCMGQEAEGLFEQFQLSESDAKDYEKVIEKYNIHFTPKRNFIHEHAIFNERIQESGENVETYIRSLYELASRCNFGEMKEMCIRDRLVVGLRDKTLSTELQMKHDLTLETAVQLARNSEQVKQQISLQSQHVPIQAKGLDSVTKKTQKNVPNSRNTSSSTWKNTCGYSRTKCGRCGGNHVKNSCPAFHAECRRCHRKGHYAKFCRTKSSASKKVREVGLNESEKEEPFFLGDITDISSVKMENNCNNPWIATIAVNKSKVRFKVDSGADVTVMSMDTYKKIKQNHLKETSHVLSTAAGSKLKCYGMFRANMRYAGRQYKENVYVTDSINNLLSRSMCQVMGILTVNIAECKYGDEEEIPENEIFGDIGMIKGEPVKIKLKENAVPFHINSARRVALPLMDKVKKEIERMESYNVISKVTKPTEWCSPMTVVLKKNGNVRLCVDLRQLNRSVKRERFVLPTLQDIASKLKNAKIFSTLDAASGYHQLMLDDDSAELTTFMTPFGRYMYKRLPFGITSASEIFQRKMSEILEGIDGIAVYQDDVIVTGSNLKEHDQRLNKVFHAIHKVGLKLNIKKCVFREEELDYLGHRFNKDGMSPAPEKVAAIKDLKSPENVSELKRILGMINYVGQYIPNLSKILQPMNSLLKKDNAWTWDEAQERAFIKIKELLSIAPTLAYFDKDKETIVSADSSSYGLGAVLLQMDGDKLRPVAYASRTLLESETKYAQIEKECLASVWACEKFHRYLYGLPQFKLITDHKPLVPLINSDNLNKAPLRCQRLLMRLMRYCPIAEFAPGKTLLIADTLSRAPVQNSTEKDQQYVEEILTQEEAVEKSWPVSDEKLNKIRQISSEDSIISEAVGYTVSGWPKYGKDVPEYLRCYYEAKSHLSVANGLLLYDTRIVIPGEMRTEVLKQIHIGHQGINKSRERAESCVWWPQITKEIKDYVSRCDYCQIHRAAQRREPLETTPLPKGPWERIGVDTFVFEKQNYLIVTDYYSRYPEIIYLQDYTSSGVIMKLKCIFARWGIPLQLISDNGPQFSSLQFQTFATEYNFQHFTSSPRFPQSNGEAERFVQIAKKILGQKDVFLALMAYRSTANSTTGKSPASMMMNREIRTTLPMIERNLESQKFEQIDDKVRKADTQAKHRHAFYYNKRYSATKLPELHAGDKVRIRTSDDKHWSEKGTVIKQTDQNRSYLIQSPDGRTLRRNRIHLQKVPSESNEDEETNKPQVIPVPVAAEKEITPEEIPDTKDTNAGYETPVLPKTTRLGRVVKPPVKLNI